MKRTLLIVALIIGALPSFGQVFNFDMLSRNQNVKVKLNLKDSKTEEPVAWASVYLIPENDTTITHFALSDTKGDVELKEVPVGRYELNAEMIGYHPYKKVCNIKHNWEGFDLGVIKMEENAEFIDAASISAVGNAITVKQDTIEYNASSFKVGEGAMLEDLLKKMPGMEIGEDGSVSVNGEKVNKITVGGKTFFFDDPNAALKNLPAKIVDKVKVIDKTKDEAQGSAIVSQDDKEKVMDVELKEEYTKGWFGNAKLGGGATLTPDTDDKLIDDRNLLYSSNAMVTGYTEKDQFIFIGNAYNVTEPGAQIMVVRRLGDDASDQSFNNLGGLGSSAQTGINYNTDRIKGMETNANIKYNHNGKVARQKSSRTSFQAEGGDILTEGEYDATGRQNDVAGSMELRSKPNDKYNIYFRPSIGYRNETINTANKSVTSGEMGKMNSSDAVTSSHADEIYTNGNLFGTLKNLGKEKRNLNMGVSYGFAQSDRTTRELSELAMTESKTVKDLSYLADVQNLNLSGNLEYSEPLAEKWAFQAGILSMYSAKENTKDAWNADGTFNDYYSSVSDNYYLREKGSLEVQFSNDTSTVQFGVAVEAVNNEVRAKSLGVETLTGKDEWLVNWSPSVMYRYRKGGTNLYIGYDGYASQPSASKMIPTIDISNPIQITAGNIYLKPNFSHDLYSSFRTNNRETFSFLNAYVNFTMTTRSIVNANWFDNEGVRYSVPVNSKKPQTRGYVYLTYNRPLGKERRFTLTVSGDVNYTGNYSYQATSRLEGMNLKSFDYNDFMKNFWGNSDGDIFYSGQSGFAESRTNTIYWGGDLKLKYSIDKLDATLSASTSNRVSRYSLDKSANINTWDSKAGLNVLYRPGKDWEFDTDLNYIFYKGYSYGFGAPEWNWDLTVKKSIKSVTLSLVAADILNQTRNLRRTVSAEYMEDVYNNILGRYFLFSVQFNFGKVNAKKNGKIQNAMFNML